jgi:hypothetical protein
MKSEKRKVKNVPKNGDASPKKAKYDWINPTRPATEKEIEQMLIECEKSLLLSSKEARKQTVKELKSHPIVRDSCFF